MRVSQSPQAAPTRLVASFQLDHAEIPRAEEQGSDDCSAMTRPELAQSLARSLMR